MLNQEGYAFGGEQSGHIIFREFATTGDGQLTAIQLLSHLKESKKTLGELCKVMKKYPQTTVNIHADESDKINFFTDEGIKAILEDARMRIGDRGRIVVRPSGTEPVIRIMAEGDDADETKKIAEETAAKIGKNLEEYKQNQ